MKTKLIRYAMIFFIFFIGYYFFIGEKIFGNTLKISIILLIVNILVDTFVLNKKVD